MQQSLLLKRGLILEYLTLGWNVVGVVIVAAAAYVARSVALAGFGLDSLIEIFASVIVVWHLRGCSSTASAWHCGSWEAPSLPSRSTF